MVEEIFELPQHLDKDPVKEVSKEPVAEAPVPEVEPEEAKRKPRVRKIVDETTRELLLDKLKKSRKIKELTAEAKELKEKISKLEEKPKVEEKVAEPVPIFKEEPKIKRTVKPKIKTIDSPKEDKLVEPYKKEIVEVPVAKPKVIYSTMKLPIW